MLGKPVIRGTRIPVELLLRKLGEGATEEDLLDAYPRLSREDIRIQILILAYSAELVHPKAWLWRQITRPLRRSVVDETDVPGIFIQSYDLPPLFHGTG